MILRFKMKGAKIHSQLNPTRTDEKEFPSVFCCSLIILLLGLCGCSDLMHPVDSTPTPTEYEFNYWLLQKTYLYENELEGLPSSGDSVQTLYRALSDPFTRYIPPSKSESASISLETSIVQGDVGMEYYLGQTEHPLYIYRVYPKGPAGRAGIPRHGNILSINEIELIGSNAYSTYDSVLSHSKDIRLIVSHEGDTLSFELTKEDVYAPTVFIDTLYGTEFIKIKEFKPVTADKQRGTYGELKDLLDTLKDRKLPRVIDLRGNPGGHVSQCIAMADLFIKEGRISTRCWRSLQPDGSSVRKSLTVSAVSGDPGEDLPFVLLLNKGSASCAEIFAAAISESSDIPVAGSVSYGKGIGQSTWKTKDNGLAIITNLDFLTPKGNSYHKKGIVPQYMCDSTVPATCAIDAIQKHFGEKLSSRRSILNADEPQVIFRNQHSTGGALIFGGSNEDI